MVAMDSDSELERGNPAPDFQLRGVDGDNYTLESFVDKDALLLVFTCNHCPYAQAKFELLNELAAEYDDCAVVGVNPNDEEQYPEDAYKEMVARVDEGVIDWDAYLRDDTQVLASDYDARCTPDPFLFRNDGVTFRLAYHGRLDDALDPDDEPTEVYIRDAIDAVLGGDDVGVPDRPSRGCSIKWRED